MNVYKIQEFCINTFSKEYVGCFFVFTDILLYCWINRHCLLSNATTSFFVVCYVTPDMYLTISLSYGACLGLWFKIHGTIIIAITDWKMYWNVLRTFNIKCTLLFLIIKATRCTNFSNLFLDWNCTCFGQFPCPSWGVFRCTHSIGICRTGVLTACKQDQDGTAVPS